jgi:hypothetical protein
MLPQIPQPPKPAMPAMTPGLAGGANKFATGNKTYGAGQVGSATSGVLAKTGYAERERKKKMRQLAIQNAMQSADGTDTLGSAL